MRAAQLDETGKKGGFYLLSSPIVWLLPLFFFFTYSLSAQVRIIRNQATVSFTVDGVEYTATSNIVTTSVLPVYGFEVIPNGDTLNPAYSVKAFPGNELYLQYILRNFGNTPDSFRLWSTYVFNELRLQNLRIYLDANSNGRVDPGEDVPISQVDYVAPDSFVSLILAIHVPEEASSGDSTYVDIVAQSLSNEIIDDDNWSLVRVSFGVALSAWKSVNKAVTYPGDTLRYEVGFVNVGRQMADSVVLIDYINYNGSTLYTTFVPYSEAPSPSTFVKYLWRNDLVWHDSLPSEPEMVAGLKAVFHNISPGQEGRFWFSVVVDSNVPDTVDIENTALFISYGVQGRVSDTTLTNIAISIPHIIPGIHIGPAGNPLALPGGEGSNDDVQQVDSAQSGVWLRFTNTILNEGPVSTLVEIEVDTSNLGLGPHPIFYLTDATLQNHLFDSDADGNPDIGPIEPGQEINIGLKVWIPDSVVDSGKTSPTHRRFLLRVFPEGYDSADNITINEFSVTRTPGDYRVELRKSVEPDTVVFNGTMLQFNIVFENVGDSILRPFNIYDYVDTVFADPVVPATISVEDMRGNYPPIVARGEYDSVTRFVSFHLDSLPVRFMGKVHFEVSAEINDSLNEAIGSNVASGIGRGMDRADTSNRVFIHILRPILEITKKSLLKQVSIGDVAYYEITVSNNSSSGTLDDIVVTDTLPEGFRFLRKSSVLPAGVRILSDSGSVIVLRLDSLPAQNSVKMTIALLIGPGVRPGKTENRAWASALMPVTHTLIHAGPAVAILEVDEGFTTPRGFVFGKVFVDENDNGVQDEGEPGVPDVIVRLDNGVSAVTDSSGKYTIPAVNPGVHGVWLDMSTIPPGLIPAPISFTSMEDGRSRIIKLPPSSSYKANFRLVRQVVRTTRFEGGVELTKSARVISDSISINITLPSVHFKTGKADLMPDAPVDEIEKVAMLLKSLPGWHVIVEGHTDPRPIHTKEFPDNYALSRARAKTVADLLVRFGVPESLIEIHGYGPDRPKVPNTSPANMAINRRTEIRLLPSEAAGLGIVEYRITFSTNEKPVDSLLIADLVPSGMRVDSVWWELPSGYPQPELLVKDRQIELIVPHVAPHDTVSLLYRVRVVDAFSAVKYYNNATATFYMNGTRLGRPLRSSVGIAQDEIKMPVTYTIRFPSDILFETGKAELRRQSLSYLEDVLKIMTEYPHSRAVLEGHTDPRPIHTKEFPSNMELSKARAMAVYRWLVQHGIDSSRLEVKWFSDTRPLVPNTSTRNMALNRRTEVIIYFPPGQVKNEVFADSDRFGVVTLRFRIKGNRTGRSIKIEDHLKQGQGYVSGSAFVNGVKLADPIVLREPSGTKLIFEIPPDVIDGADTLVLTYFVSSSTNPAPDTARQDSVDPLDMLTVDDVPRILYPVNGQLITDRSVINIDVLVHYLVPFKLRVNGEVVPMEKCGVTKKVQTKLIEERRFIGIRLKAGENIITLKGVDKNGHLVEDTVRVYIAGSPAVISMKLLNAPVPADGLTPPRILIELKDSSGLSVGSNIVLDLQFEGVEPLTDDRRAVVPGYQVLIDSGRAILELKPSYTPKKGKVIASYSSTLVDTIEVEYRPNVKPMELFTFASIDYNLPNAYHEGALNSTTYLWANGKLWRDVILTASVRHDPYYDSLTNAGNGTPLFGTVSPLNDLYPTYGDASRLINFSTSRTGIFLRLEKGLSYIQYGDFKGFLSKGNQNYSRYSRALTGVSFHIEGKLAEAEGVLAQDGQIVKTVELPANGTFGPFQLPDVPIITNSEEIYLITRDRLHPEIIIRRVKLKQGQDYLIDPSTGSIELKAPIPSYDDEMNPNYLAVTYEVFGSGGRWAYGGKLVLHPVDNIDIGFTVGHSSPSRQVDKDVRGAFLNLQWSFLKGNIELARSYSGGQATGDAVSTNLSLSPSSKFTFKMKYSDKSSGFDNPSAEQPVNTSGTRDGMASFKYLLTDNISLSGRFDIRQMNGNRIGTSAEALTKFRFKPFSLGIGYRRASETSDSTHTLSDMGVVTLGASLFNRLKLSVRHEQVFNSTGAISFAPPKSTARLGFAFTKNIILSLSAEHRWDSANATTALLGFELKPRENTKAYTRYRIPDVGGEKRNEAIVGLSQTIPLSPALRLTANAEYSRITAGIVSSRLTAAFGAEFKGKNGLASLKISDIYQNRGHNFNLTASSALRLLNGLGLVLNEKIGSNMGKLSSDGIVGLAYRPDSSDRINLFAVLRHHYTNDSSLASKAANRVTFMTDVNFQPVRRLIMGGRFGAKYLPAVESRPTTFLLSTWVQYQLPYAGVYVMAGNRSIFQPVVSASESDIFLEVGTVLIRGLSVGIGYNFHGVSDESWTGDHTWNKGFYLSLRAKYLRTW